MSKEVIIVTGLSGAGKSTALHVFEDMRHFTADGVPPVLVPDMVRLLLDPAVPHQYEGIALGLDQRRSGFADDVASACRQLVGLGLKPLVLYLEADPAVIMRRYATTRRPHPLERQGVGLEQAIFREMERLSPLRDTADMLFDTSTFSLHDLRRHIQHRWNAGQADKRSLKVNVLSFGFKYGAPREADLVFDLRFLPNPYFVESLRPLCGKDKPVVDHVFADAPAQEFRRRFLDFLQYLLPLYEAEGRYRLTVAIGCTGGRHRSVAMAEATAKALTSQQYEVTLEHRHMDLG